MRWASFSRGEIVVRQGDHGSNLYVIEDGEVEVIEETGPRSQLLGVLGPGQHFGERAVFDGHARTATVRARSDVRALLIERAHALTFSRAVPEFGDSVSQLPSGIKGRPRTSALADAVAEKTRDRPQTDSAELIRSSRDRGWR